METIFKDWKVFIYLKKPQKFKSDQILVLLPKVKEFVSEIE